MTATYGILICETARIARAFVDAHTDLGWQSIGPDWWETPDHVKITVFVSPTQLVGVRGLKVYFAPNWWLRSDQAKLTELVRSARAAGLVECVSLAGAALPEMGRRRTQSDLFQRAPRRRQVFDFIRAEVEAGRPFPTASAIASLMGWNNPGSARDCLMTLAFADRVIGSKRVRFDSRRWGYQFSYPGEIIIAKEETNAANPGV